MDFLTNRDYGLSAFNLFSFFLFLFCAHHAYEPCAHTHNKVTQCNAMEPELTCPRFRDSRNTGTHTRYCLLRGQGMSTTGTDQVCPTA